MTIWQRLVNWITGKKAPAPTPVPSPTPTPAPAPTPSATFSDNFATLDTTKWQVSNWAAPSSSSTNHGTLAPSQVTANGILCLKLSQTKNADGTFNSVGGELATVQSFGYGTYQYEMRASSTSNSPTVAGSSVSGSITGAFSYGPNSVTEIDVEVEGDARSGIVEMTTWKGDTNPNEYTEFDPAIAPYAGFHTYKIVWTATSIAYYVDGVLVSTHTTVVPSTPVPFVFNHYGTNNPTWGGVATPGVDRYMFVKNFTFTAA